METRSLRPPELLLFEVSRPGRRGFDLPALDVPEPEGGGLDRRYLRDRHHTAVHERNVWFGDVDSAA